MDIAFLKSAFRESQYPPADKPEVAFAGRSNVGKSSVINVLVKRKKLARTSSTPGRTQAINFFSVGDRFNLVDLPGYGYARVPPQVRKAWGTMVETYLRTRSNLRAVVVILDIRRDPAEGDVNLIEWLEHYGKEMILVLTKTDKVSRGEALARAKRLGHQLARATDRMPIVFSAKTREGREEIWEEILRLTET
ncbi:MAG: ribosome biogenesis GTP-binding protein YihA/YsxC [Proteobacteria bacterium]|nr:ribosome biogenesis GTP-binding protein YihA/YsxC [Pseudomonadota bacterium]